MHVSTLPGKVNLTGNASRGSMRSDFDSVTSQSGIHAGSDGYEITVKENTRLKGGLIDSVANADKNRLTTGTLAWEDMKTVQTTKRAVWGFPTLRRTKAPG